MSLLYHAVTGFAVDATEGVVYGLRGRPLRRHNVHGYLRGAYRVDDRTKHVMLHRVVWESVHGPIAGGLEVNHINGVKDDNRLANLELVTRHENIRHSFATGLNQGRAGERNKQAKLTRADVDLIRSLSHLTQKARAAMFGMSNQAISCICRGQTWKD